MQCILATLAPGLGQGTSSKVQAAVVSTECGESHSHVVRLAERVSKAAHWGDPHGGQPCKELGKTLPLSALSTWV